ncbi:hypothetical protein ACFXKC_32455 [Streptomyces sp. NPDC059340]|uniref:hypothetical protein n=1 Tax=Streptomyces sp. NPDC059340 TaxID=3346806 RepID=UPI0036B613C2
MPEQEPPVPAAPAAPADGESEQTAAAAQSNGRVPSFPSSPEAAQGWMEIEPDHMTWRRGLVERQLRQEQLDQWAGYGFRLLEYMIVVGFGVAFVWLGFYAVDHNASLQAVPLISGGVAGVVGAVLAVRNKRQ